jgi:2-phosphosulfolactate phosphatase
MQDIKMTFAHELMEEYDLSGEIAVVVDALRATTTITYALAAGAREVLFFEEVDEARSAAVRFGRDTCVLGGERGGLRIEGFDIGNSPTECTRELLEGRTFIITTTNGTRALAKALGAKRIVVGSMANAGAVAERLSALEEDIHFVLAGANGDWAADDAFCAGRIIDALLSKKQCSLHDSADVAWAYFKATRMRAPETFRESLSGRKLLAIGLGDDVEVCLQSDLFDFVPEVDKGSFRIIRRHPG